uniref:NAD(P)-binding domain-containing protein n=1 Tax=Fibrocapsa japonica TaxID=94617 RepID=A0A7S2USW7_9STRA|mmetsp:Transcript_11742/g.17357  ORF Transcript_11742/g.17357 Transcript_11742/m.17357 type:complete len:265 (+) Transcript_11742:82-876(+)
MLQQAKKSLVRNVLRSLSTSSNQSTEQKVVVLGGNGYVGQQVCKMAKTMMNCEVVSISRSGAPNFDGAEKWTQEISWEKGDVLEASTWKDHLDGATGVVSCIGAFASTNDAMEYANGDTNIAAAKTAKAAGVANFVFVSTVENNLPEFVLAGYFKGKRRAEDQVLESFPQTGVVLRPSFVYGSRAVGKGISIPLWLVGKPMDMIFSTPPFEVLASTLPGAQAILAAPVPVETVGLCAAAGAVAKLGQTGIVSTKDMKRLAKALR